MSADDIRVGLVKVDEVRFHPHNVRRDLGDLRALTNSIRKFGILQPIVVENRGDHWRLRAGHRRVAAARLAGVAKVPAVIHKTELDDDEWIIQSIQENVHRAQLDAQDRTDAVRALRDLGCTWEGIAEAFGVRPYVVQRWLKPPKPGTPQPSPIRRTMLRTFTDLWREALDDGASPDALLDALTRLAETGSLESARPAKAEAGAA